MNRYQALNFGSVLSGVAYGVAATLCGMCIQLLLKTMQPQNSNRPSRNIILLLYTLIMFILSTITIVSYTHALWWTWEGDRIVDLPGLGEVGAICTFIGNWMADALLVWRCITIYRGSKFLSLLVNGILICLLASSVALGVAHIARNKVDVKMAEASLFATIALNCVATSMIVGRILFQQRRITMALGRKHGMQYTRVITMLVESAALLLLFGIFFAITVVLRSPVQYLFTQFIGHVQAIASFLIIMRVSQGKAWSSNIPSPSPYLLGNDSIP